MENSFFSLFISGPCENKAWGSPITRYDSEQSLQRVYVWRNKPNNRPWLCNYTEYWKHCISSQKTWVMSYLSALFENYGLKSLSSLNFISIPVKWKPEELAFTKHLPHAMYYFQCSKCIDLFNTKNTLREYITTIPLLKMNKWCFINYIVLK